MEEWKDISGFEGFYQVSNLGRIKSLDRHVSDKKGDYFILGKILNPPILKNGYILFTLCKNGIRKQLTGHRIVANAFLEKEKGRSIVNHKNGIKHDNRTENLEWTSNRENQVHYRKVLIKSQQKTGVCFRKDTNKWRAKIKIDDKAIILGTFLSEDEAHEAYQRALIKYGLQNKYAA